MDNRTRARELAIQALFQLDIQGSDLLSRLGEFFTENEPDSFTRKLANQWTKDAWEHLDQCDELISACAIKWKMDRLSFVDKSILRLSVYQLKFCEDIPAKVVINEAIELAKKFSTEQSPRFVNGVLDAAMKKLKAEQQ